MKTEKRYLFKSIFIKFVLAFTIVGLLPLAGISYFIFETLPGDMERDMISNYSQMLLYSSKNIEKKISEYNQISQLIYNFRSREYGSIIEILDNRQSQLVEDFLRSTVYSEKYIESAFLMDEELNIKSYFTQNAFPFVEGFNMSIYPGTEQIPVDKRSLTILPAHEEDYFFRSESTVVSIVRNYLDISYLPEEEKVVSVFSIEVNTNFIKDIIDPLSINKEEQVFVLNSRGFPVFSSFPLNDPEKPAEIYNQIIPAAREHSSGVIPSESGYLFYREIENTDWFLIFKLQHGSIYQLINEFKKLGLIIISLMIVTLIALALAFSRRLSQPIRNIMNQMKLVESGDLTSEVRVKSHDEIHQLAQAFNRMVKRLNTYINKAYVAQIKQKETDLNAIRTQIRPHYLYNTLEIIRMSALDEGAGNTQKMIFALSEQMKYLIGYSEPEVTLMQELEMVKSYFDIVHYRYEQRIRLDLDIPVELQNYKVLKLMIQPLVENAVVHGLKPKEGKGTVKISAAVKDDILKIQIIDDGIGIDADQLIALQSRLDSRSADTGKTGEEHIGLSNVQNRIHLVYGSTYGIKISSRKGTGALMTITIPAEKRSEPC
ncbi:MAG: sensor histidine kinase [Spirochaetales bacterium]|nr:sensor histidine kinase [Spirochaetales bacterium]